MRDKSSPLASFIDSFLLAKRLGESSKRDYRRFLRDFDEFTGRTSLEAALTLDNAAAWKQKIAGVSVYTAHNGVAYLKSFAKWCAEAGHLRSPYGTTVLIGLETPRPPDEGREPFTDEEVDRMFAALIDRTNRDRRRALAYAWLLIATGIRLNEARCLALTDVHYLDQHPYVIVQWRHAKGKLKSRHARLNRQAVIAIDEYVQDGRPDCTGLVAEGNGDALPAEPLFLTEHGIPFSRSGFGKWAGRIKDEIEKAGVRDWKSHRMRATWATLFNRASTINHTTFIDLKAEGGWSDDRTPQRYVKPRPWAELIAIPSSLDVIRAHKQTA